MAKRPTTKSTQTASPARKKTAAKTAAVKPVKPARTATASKTTAKPSVATRAKTGSKAGAKPAARSSAKKAVKKPAAKKPTQIARTKTTPRPAPIKTTAAKPVKAKRLTLAELHGQVTEITKRLKKADTRTHNNVKALEAAFKALEGQVKDHQTVNHAALNRRVDQLSGQFTASMHAAKRDIAADLQSALNNPSIARLQTAIDRSQARLAKAEAAQTQSMSRVNKLVADLARVIDARFQEQSATQKSQTARLAAIEQKLADIQQDTGAQSRSIEDTTATAIRKIGDDVVSTTQNFQDKLDQQSAVLREKVADIGQQTQEDFDRHKYEISRQFESLSDNVRNQNSSLERALNQLTSRIDNLEFGLSSPSDPVVPAPPMPEMAPTSFEPQPDAFAPVEHVPNQAGNPYLSVVADNSSVADTAAHAYTETAAVPIDAFSPPQQPAQPQEAIYQETPYQEAAYQEPQPYQPQASHHPQEFQPQEYIPAATGTMDGTVHQQPAHHYVDPQQAALMTPPAQPYMDESSLYVYEAPPAQVTQAPDTATNGGITEFIPATEIGADDLPYENPGYSEPSSDPAAVSRPGHIENLKTKAKKAKAKQLGRELPGIAGMSPRNLKVAGLAVALAGIGYFGLRGFVGKQPITSPPVVEANSQSPTMAAGGSAPVATLPVSTTEPIGTYQDNLGSNTVATQTATAAASGLTLQQAAENGDPVAQFQLGITYLDAGQPNAALKHIRASANQGQPAAQYRLAKLYEAGIGVKANPDMARDLTERAARSGNRIAMHDLGLYYAEGRGGVERNIHTAVSWFEKAAERGVVDSQYNLGVLFETNTESFYNPSSAFVWYSIASQQGDQLAANRVAILKDTLSADDLAQAERRITQFKPTAIDEPANGIFRQVPWSMPDKMDVKPSADLVRDAQSLLGQLGYDVGAPDGDAGPRTRAAVVAFEKAYGLPETGIVSASLVDRLSAAAGA